MPSNGHLARNRLASERGAISLKKLRLEVLRLLGNECQRCGFIDLRTLQIDHINGGGNKERRLIPSPRAFLRHVMAHLSNYQLLCANCNCIKASENKELPTSAWIRE